ncbi:MAG TPA: glycosyltransferase, partial [Chitinophagaceae bacterium]
MIFGGKHILIIVENLPVPFDRRVWEEANTLKENGAHVSVICPKMKGFTKSYECINGIEIYRHSLPIEASKALGYLLEYTIALFWEFFLSWKIFFKKRFHVIHGCNPPDLVFVIALSFKLFGVKYVFDHHDINPELYEAKYKKKNLFYRLLVLLEKITFQVADYSIATNESFKKIAINRGRMEENKIAVIR